MYVLYVAYQTNNICISGYAHITNGMAAVTVFNLQCNVSYNITAGGRLNGKLVGPRSSHGNVDPGPCPTSECSYVY